MLTNTAGGSTMRLSDMYPGTMFAGLRSNGASVTNAASNPQPPSPATSPAVALIAIVVILVVIRVVYEMAPSGGKGI